MGKSKAKPTEGKQVKAAADRPIASADLPRKSLEEALRVARVIKDEYAGKLATWDDIANGMGFSPTNPNNKYFLWAATAYGIIEKDQDEQYRLTEIGRKILAPTYEGEDREGDFSLDATGRN